MSKISKQTAEQAYRIKTEMAEHMHEINGMRLRKGSIETESALIKEIGKLNNENRELKKKKEECDKDLTHLRVVNQSFILDLNTQVKKLEVELKQTNEELTAEKDKNESLESELKKLNASECKKFKAKDKIIADLRVELENAKKSFNESNLKINDLTKKVNSRPNNFSHEESKKTLLDSPTIKKQISQINSVDFSDLCEAVSMSSESVEIESLDFSTEDNSIEISATTSKRAAPKRRHPRSRYNEASDDEVTFNSSPGEQRLEFNCQIEFLLSKEIWSSFIKKTSFQRTIGHSAFLRRREMSKNQRLETDRLDVFMETLILQHFNNKTRTKSIAKTAEGYSVRRYCISKGCIVAWTFNINIETGAGSISTTRKCNHLVTDKEKYELLKIAQENSSNKDDLDHEAGDETEDDEEI